MMGKCIFKCQEQEKNMCDSRVDVGIGCKCIIGRWHEHVGKFWKMMVV